jgi:UDP-glucuronate 4-epimerase
VRYSLVNPGAYFANNLTAFGHVVEGCRHAKIAHLVYASSSSVYGANHTLPFSEDQSVDHPVSLYAATKKANELIAHSYSHLYRLPTTGLRFFTVYGPWGRPDMAPMLFAKAILAGTPIRLFNGGKMRRDFTYVDDIAEGVVRVLGRPPAADGDGAPYAVCNIGNHTSVELETFVATLEDALGTKAVREYAPMQPGDVPETCASIDRLAALTGFAPSTPLSTGLARFVAWYREYHGAAGARGAG